MKELNEDIYKKIQKLSEKVKDDLWKKGIVAPKSLRDGSIKIGHFSIRKNSDNFYSVNDFRGEVVVGKINLPHTAALVANGLALGKFVDRNILSEDRKYGYALFEEEVQTQLIQQSSKKSIEQYSIMLTKQALCRNKKDQHKNAIMRSFEKLRKIA